MLFVALLYKYSQPKKGKEVIRMKKIILLLMAVMVFCMWLLSCKFPTTPEEPDVTVYYDFWVIYERPEGTAVNPEINAVKCEWWVVRYSTGTTLRQDPFWPKKQGGAYIGEITGIPCNKELGEDRFLDFSIVDRARQVSPDKTIWAGDNIWLENKSTGAKALLTVKPCSHIVFPDTGTMGKCRILADGTPIPTN